MSEPTRGPQSQQVRDAELTTGVMRGMEQLDSLNAGLEPYPMEPLNTVPPAPYKKERLFSRKVLFGWAAATLIVWFLLTMIFPAVIGSVQTAIVSSIEESARAEAAAVPAPPPPPAAITVTPVPPVPPTVVEPAEAPVIDPAAPTDLRNRTIVRKRGPFTITILNGEIKKIEMK